MGRRIMTRQECDKQKVILHRRAMRYGKGTIPGARRWLRMNYTGDSKANHVRQAFAASGELLPAYELDAVYSSIIRRDRPMRWQEPKLT